MNSSFANTIYIQQSESQLEPILQLYKVNAIYVVLIQVTNLLAQCTNSRILQNLHAICHMRLDNSDAALKTYEVTVAMRPNDSDIYFTMEDIFSDKENFNVAVPAYEKILKTELLDGDAKHSLLETLKEKENC